ncbi:MAG TPA: HEAT repeat domain-containing protein [Terracidiphilus sp.]|nr:HEAT repeat domain-containing protein [Terracidiphilus sp.]
MSPDQISIDERPSAVPHGNRGSVVARTEQPFTGRQVLTFLVCVCVFTSALVGGWHFIRVSIQIRKLKSQDAAVRQNAALELGQFKSSRAVEPLIAALRDTDAGVVGDAAKALGQIKDLRALQPLLAAFKAGKDNPEVEQQLAQALGGLGPPALEPLMATLKDNNPNEYAEDGLVQIGGPAVDPLIAMLNDANRSLREEAASVLGEIKDPRAVEPLIATLKDNTPPPKGPVELDANGFPLPHPEEGEGLREQSARALGEIEDPRADGPLIAAMRDSDARVHQIAAHALGEINDPQAVNFLSTALREHNTEVIAGASDFYIRRGDPGTEDALIDALNKSGDTDMAEELLNSGNTRLHDAASDWASANHYVVNYMPGGKATSWGGRQ